MNQYRTRILIGAAAGTILSWTATGFILDSMFAYGGYTQESLVELPPWAGLLIGLAGALFGAAVATVFGNVCLPHGFGKLARGAVYGVAIAVIITIFVASICGGPTSKGQAPYLIYGFRIGVPTGLVLGCLMAMVINGRSKIRQMR